MITKELSKTETQRIWLDEDAVRRDNRRHWLSHRAWDILCSLLALLVLCPVLLIIAVAIVLDDPKGGPIYVQTRIGQDGKPFRFYKFRSMCVGAEKSLDSLLDQNEMDGPVFKIKDDPRITRIGGFIRRTSIDELPQLFNILKGDMTIVGPRPALSREVEQYEPYHRQRLLVKPGLTGLWQIQPNRNGLSFEEWIRLDLQYIRDRSFRNDWKIIFKTLRAVVMAEGE